MKKYLSSVLSLILAVAVVATLVGCNDNSDEDSTSVQSYSSQGLNTGSDENSVTSSEGDMVVHTSSLAGDWEGTYHVPDIESGVDYYWDVSFTFNSDGTYKVTHDAEGYANAMIQFSKDMCDAQNIDFDEYLEKCGFSSIDEYREDRIEYQKNVRGEGEYEYDGSKFVANEREYDCEWEGSYFIFGDESFKAKIKKIVNQ